MSKKMAGGATDAEVLAMLKRYGCPTPFHEVRTRFLGSIASPVPGASPMATVKQLWGGELPPVDSVDEVNELFAMLVAGLWNRLTEHQNSRNPFKLLRFDVSQTREGLGHLALVRKQELDGFVEGLFGPEPQIELPQRAHEALEVLAELRSFLVGALELLSDLSKPAGSDDIKALLHHVQRMTIIAETEMNKANLSCKRARVQQVDQLLASKPTLH